MLLESGGALDPTNKSFGVRTARYAYLELSTGRRELYDLDVRPRAARATEPTTPRWPTCRRGLASQLAELEECAGAACDVG